jgi:hypothetical protein
MVSSFANQVEEAIKAARAVHEPKATELEHSGQASAAQQVRMTGWMEGIEAGLIKLSSQVEEVLASVVLNS